MTFAEVMAVASEVLQYVNIGVWIYVFYSYFSTSKKFYGSSFTSVFPLLLGSISMILMVALFVPIISHFPPSTGILIIQSFLLMSGFLLMRSMYIFYTTTFATRGFERSE